MGAARVWECQRGIVPPRESAEERGRAVDESSDTRLGSSGRRLEPCHSDQKPAEIVGFMVIRMGKHRLNDHTADKQGARKK